MAKPSRIIRSHGRRKSAKREIFTIVKQHYGPLTPLDKTELADRISASYGMEIGEVNHLIERAKRVVGK